MAGSTLNVPVPRFPSGILFSDGLGLELESSVLFQQMVVKYHSVLSFLRTVFREPPPALMVGVGSLSRKY